MDVAEAEQLAEENSSPEATDDAYILGGADLEMLLIERRLEKFGALVVGATTTWEEADVTKRSGLIAEAQAQGRMPVLIEHRGADEVPGIVHIDHHDKNAHRDASILQVLERLGVDPNFVDKIVAANDSGYIPGMEALLDGEYKDRFISKRIKAGIDSEKVEQRYQEVRTYIINAVRLKDREAQGVTATDETEAEEAIERMEDRDGLKVVSLKGRRNSPVNDRLYPTWEDGKENLVVVCAAEEPEKEVWFFGPGDVCKDTLEHFKELKKKRIEANPDEPERRGIYHTVGGGKGFGESDKITRCLVVASDPEEVISYIHELEKQRTVHNA